MQSRQKQVIEAYLRVQDFLAANVLPAGGDYGEPKRLLDEVVGRLTGHSTDQMEGGRLSRAETKRQDALRKALRELHLKPIWLIARASLRNAPGIDRALRMPSPQLSTTRLIADSLAIRGAIAQYEPAFVKNGRPADFLARLDAAIDAVRQSVLGRARNVGKQVGARAGLGEEIQRGRSAVDMLDAIVSTSFAGQPDVLARWRIAKRIRAIPGGTVAATGGTADENLPAAKVAA